MPESTFERFADEIKVMMESEPHGPDRVVGILYGALVENQLTAALQITLYNDKKVWNELFRPGAPIGSFGPKLQLAYMLNIITKTEYEDIDRIIKIRNKFAHKVRVSSFDDPPVRDWVTILSTCASYKNFYDKAAAKYGNEPHPMVYNGIIIRKDSKRSLFQWAAKHYYELLSVYEINTFGVQKFGDGFEKIKLLKPSP